MTRIAPVAGFLAVALWVAGSAAGGILATDSNGMEPWQDTLYYESISVNVDLDFCVYEPGQFTKTFNDPFPAVDGDHYVYAYQVVEVADGSVPSFSSFVLQLSVGLDADEEVGVIGSYDDGSANLVSPDNPFFAGDYQTAVWHFSPTVQIGEHSAILYFTSPFAPEFDNGTVTGWMPAGTQNVPSPVPEPGTLALLAGGAVASLFRMRRKRVT